MSIPVSFSYDGKRYSGVLSQVQGQGATSVYHLTIDNYYRGRLRVSAFDNKWVFDGQYAELAEYFGGVVEKHFVT